MTFAEAVKTVRTRRALTQAALAKKAGLSRTQVARYERGLAPGPQALQRLVGGLGFASGLELLADAGDAEAVEKLKSTRTPSRGSRVWWLLARRAQVRIARQRDASRR